jgi:hypothetical protein
MRNVGYNGSDDALPIETSASPGRHPIGIGAQPSGGLAGWCRWKYLYSSEPLWSQQLPAQAVCYGLGHRPDKRL